MKILYYALAIVTAYMIGGCFYALYERFGLDFTHVDSFEITLCLLLSSLYVWGLMSLHRRLVLRRHGQERARRDLQGKYPSHPAAFATPKAPSKADKT